MRKYVGEISNGPFDEVLAWQVLVLCKFSVIFNVDIFMQHRVFPSLAACTMI